jgi:hypothetical protein
MVWNEWTLDRVVLLFVGFAYLFIGIQVTMSHYRQNFHNKAMFAPVILAPINFLAALGLTLLNTNGWYFFMQFLLYLDIVVGLIGFYFHFKGVGVRVGGYTLRNFLVGPPVILPLLFSAMGVLGLIAVYGG